jgi:hypothetical protein
MILRSEKDPCRIRKNGRRHGDEHLPVRQAVRWAVDTAHDLWQIARSPKQKPATGVV